MRHKRITFDLPSEPPDDEVEKIEEDPDDARDRMQDEEWPKIGQFYTPENGD